MGAVGPFAFGLGDVFGCGFLTTEVAGPRVKEPEELAREESWDDFATFSAFFEEGDLSYLLLQIVKRHISYTILRPHNMTYRPKK